MMASPEKPLISVFTENQISEWHARYERIPTKGAYHEPTYIKRIAAYYSGRAELFWCETKNAVFYHPYIRRDLKGKASSLRTKSGKPYSDIISSWYYGGPLACPLEDAKTVSKEDVKQFLSAFDAYCLDDSIVSEFLRFDPNLENYSLYEGTVPLIANRKTVAIDLKQSEEKIWAGLASRNRNRCRNAEKMGFEVEFSRAPEAIEAFHSIYKEEMERKEADTFHRFPLSFFLDLFENCPESFYLILAKHKNTYAGGIICAQGGAVVHDFLRASRQKYWSKNINNWMILQSILFAKNTRKASCYDLQGGRDGVFHFKSGFSKLRKEFKTYAKVHNREIYDTLTELVANNVEGCDQGFFPAYRINDL